MKIKNLLKMTFIVTLITASRGLGWGQTTINFDTAENWIQAGSTSLTSYAAHAYQEAGVLIQGTNVLRNTTAAQDGFPGALGTYSMRVGNTAVSKVVITVSSGGVSTFSIKTRRWDNSPMPNYTVKYSVNGGTDWTNLTNIDGTLLTTSDFFTYGGTINSAVENVLIEIKNTGTTERIMLDDFSWSGFAGGNQTPTIANIVQNPSTLVQYNTPVGVSATITDADGTIAAAELRWGKTALLLDNAVPMSLVQETYTASIPEQANGTTVYYAIYAEDNEGGTTTSTTRNYTVSPVIYTETFDSGLGTCSAFSVSGDTKFWVQSAGVALMNGYNTGEVEEDWLFLPVQNLDAQDLLLSFETYKRYGITDENNYLKLYYSTNYTGQGSPVQSTWLPLTFTQPEVDMVWTPSGTVDLSNISGDAVYIAFKYTYSTGTYVSWSIDNIKLERKTYSVTFSVINGTNPAGTDPINTATVNFYNTPKLTNETGQAIYTWVETENSLPFTVTKNGYHDFTGTLNVANKDLTQQVKMLSTKVAVNVNATPNANTASISWVGSGAEAYRIRYRVANSNSYLYLNSLSSPTTINVFPETNYEVMVSSKIDGIWSNFTSPVFFTTLEGIQIVANNISVTDITSSSATINWEGSGADLYRIRYNITGSTFFKYLNSSSSSTAIPVFPESSYEVSVASMVGGIWLAYTAPVRFETPTGAQASNVTISSITSSTAQVNWNGSGADRYRIRYREDGSTIYKYIDTYSSPTSINSLLTETTYEVCVASRVSGVWYPYTSPVKFTTPAFVLMNSFATVTGSSTVDLLSNVQIYPNPATNFANLRLHVNELTDLTITVYDITGSIVKTERLYNQNGDIEARIELDGINKGTYIIRISSMQKSETIRLMIQ
jgi:hypothetical protein